MCFFNIYVTINYNYTSVHYRETIFLTQLRPYCLANFKRSDGEDFALNRWFDIVLIVIKCLYSLGNGQPQKSDCCP